MATVKYIGESPFAGINTRTHHESDFRFEAQDVCCLIYPLSPRYRQYEENLSCSEGSSPSIVKLAIFGLGRAGTIHLSNIIANPRVTVTHIVEADTTKWEPVRNKWNLATTKFVHPDKADEVCRSIKTLAQNAKSGVSGVR